MKSALCYRITKYRIKEVSRMLTHADLLRTLNGTGILYCYWNCQACGRLCWRRVV